MQRLTILFGFLATACATQGEMGEEGPPGPQGEMGTAASALGWADATGTAVANSHAAFNGTTFTMTVIDASGVFFGFNPLSGTPRYETYHSATLLRYYLASDCTGPVRYGIAVVPGVAFKLDNRVIALPSTVDVAFAAGSYIDVSAQNPTYCNRDGYPGVFVAASAMETLPTLQPPALAPGPYHVVRR